VAAFLKSGTLGPISTANHDRERPEIPLAAFRFIFYWSGSGEFAKMTLKNKG
jgi:hypothetical protein